jgi:methylmalonyl-CoA mutase N-terminal domain/subunit
VNRFTEGDDGDLETLHIPHDVEVRQVKRLHAVKADRDAGAVRSALAGVSAAAADPAANVMPALLDAARAYATVGEVITALSAVFGRYTEDPVI